MRIHNTDPKIASVTTGKMNMQTKCRVIYPLGPNRMKAKKSFVFFQWINILCFRMTSSRFFGAVRSISLSYLGVVAAGVRYELAEFHNPIVYVVPPPPLHLVVCGSPRTESLNKNG
jgi:hypothetical protein